VRARATLEAAEATVRTVAAREAELVAREARVVREAAELSDSAAHDQRSFVEASEEIRRRVAELAAQAAGLEALKSEERPRPAECRTRSMAPPGSLNLNPIHSGTRSCKALKRHFAARARG